MNPKPQRTSLTHISRRRKTHNTLYPAHLACAGVHTHTAAPIQYLSDGSNDKIQAVIEANVCPRLIELLKHKSPTVQTPALRTVGNIVSGDAMHTQVIIESNGLVSEG